jgi:hypothetical protein
MGRAARLDFQMERLRFGDEYQGPSEFSKKVRTINFNMNDDTINGVFEVNSDQETDGEPLFEQP